MFSGNLCSLRCRMLMRDSHLSSGKNLPTQSKINEFDCSTFVVKQHHVFRLKNTDRDKNVNWTLYRCVGSPTLRSRCAVLWVWRCCTPSSICLMKKLASSSVSRSRSAMKSNSSPPRSLRGVMQSLLWRECVLTLCYNQIAPVIMFIGRPGQCAGNLNLGTLGADNCFYC